MWRYSLKEWLVFACSMIFRISSSSPIWLYINRYSCFTSTLREEDCETVWPVSICGSASMPMRQELYYHSHWIATPFFIWLFVNAPPISKRQYKYWDWGIGYHERGLKVNIYCFLIDIDYLSSISLKLNIWLEHYTHNPNSKLSLHPEKIVLNNWFKYFLSKDYQSICYWKC